MLRWLPASWRTTFAAGFALLAMLTAPVRAQDTYGPSADPTAAPAARAEPCGNPAADADTIVVCRQFESGEQYMIDVPTRADTEVTGSGAPRAPDVFGMPPCSSYTVCVGFGSVPPPAIMIDFASLPETPEGSEAALLYGGPTAADTATVPEEAGEP